MKTLLTLLCLTVPAMHAGYGDLPLRLEDHGRGRFVSRGAGYAASIEATRVDIRTKAGSATLHLLGAKRHAPAEALDRLPTVSNYFIGREVRTGIANYARARFANVYDGIDLVYHGRDRRLEYDFIAAPGADPARIRMRFDGPAPHIAESGDLTLGAGIAWHKPVAYQTRDDKRVEVAARFVVRGHEVSFALGPYDKTLPLVIDPVLAYSTYVGGAGPDQATAIGADKDGNAYITGSTQSADFPGRAGQLQPAPGGSEDVFVAKLNPTGSQVLWSTYIGGTGIDRAYAIAVADDGSTFVAGDTASTNFPVTANALKTRLSGGSGITDAFVLKLNPAGTALIYSTYLGGSQNDAAYGIAIDKTGNAYVTGGTSSLDFPSTATTALPARGGGDAFAAKLNPAGTQLVYSVYLGGFSFDVGNAIAVDSAGAAVVVGETRSQNFPVTTGVFGSTLGGTSDAFIVKLNPAGDALVFATYYGGGSTEAAYGVALDGIGNIHITGITASGDLPISGNALQRGFATLPDAFIAQIDPSGRAMNYSSYFGGENEDWGRAIAINANGEIYIAGYTNSISFPLANERGLNSGFTGLPPFSNAGGFDGFIAKISLTRPIPLYSTMIGGAGDDFVRGLAVDNNGNAYIAGGTASANFRTGVSPAQPSLSGATDGFAAKFSEVQVTVTPPTATIGAGGTLQFAVTITNTQNTAVVWSVFPPNGGTISTSGLFSAPSLVTTPQIVTVTATSQADPSKSGSATINLTGAPVTIGVAPAAATLLPGQSQQFSATVTGAAAGVTWSINPAIGSITGGGLYTAPGTIGGTQQVTVTATSLADPSRAASAIVTLTPAPTGTIRVTPQTATLAPSQTQQFAAALTGVLASDVRWSISPQLGSISQTGLYTAPSVFDGSPAVTVTASSATAPSILGTAQITLTSSGPRISLQGIANAASFLGAPAMGGIAPGLILTLFGSGLGPASLAGLQLTPDNLAVGTIAGETRVLFDGVPAPMIYSLAGQVSCVAPYSLGGKDSVQVQVEYRGVRSNTVTVSVVGAAPALFTVGSRGSGAAAALNQDSSVNTLANAALRGSIVSFYATGEGLTNPAGLDGKLTTDPLPRPRQNVTVTIGGINAEVLYAGGAPGLVAGVLQVNARVPPDVLTGDAPVVVFVGSASSQPAVTLSVK